MDQSSILPRSPQPGEAHAEAQFGKLAHGPLQSQHDTALPGAAAPAQAVQTFNAPQSAWRTGATADVLSRSAHNPGYAEISVERAMQLLGTTPADYAMQYGFRVEAVMKMKFAQPIRDEALADLEAQIEKAMLDQKGRTHLITTLKLVSAEIVTAGSHLLDRVRGSNNTAPNPLPEQVAIYDARFVEVRLQVRKLREVLAMSSAEFCARRAELRREFIAAGTMRPPPYFPGS